MFLTSELNPVLLLQSLKGLPSGQRDQTLQHGTGSQLGPITSLIPSPPPLSPIHIELFVVFQKWQQFYVLPSVPSELGQLHTIFKPQPQKQAPKSLPNSTLISSELPPPSELLGIHITLCISYLLLCNNYPNA